MLSFLWVPAKGEGDLVTDKLAFEVGPEHVYIIILKLLVAVLEGVWLVVILTKKK